MKLGKALLMVLLVGCLLVPQLAVAKDTAKIGKVTSFSGTAEMKRGGGEKYFSVFKNMSFTQGDTFTTGKKSELQLLIDSDKEVTASSNTKFIISELLTSMKKTDGKTTLSLMNGKVKVKITKKLEGDSRFQVKTPTAIMGVMGTEFYVYYDQYGTWVGVLEGTVQINLLDEAGTQPIIVTPAQSFHMDQQGNWTLGTFDELQEARFYEEEESTPAEKVEREVIVYDPPEGGEGGYTVPPASTKPVLVSAEPIYNTTSEFVINYNGNQQQLTNVYYVNYYSGMNGQEAGLTRLNGGEYSVDNEQRLVIDPSYISANIDSNQQQFLLEFTEGDIIDVVMPYRPAPVVLEQQLPERMHAPLFENGRIEIPFDQPIAANGSGLSLSDGSITFFNTTNQLDVSGNVSIGGANQNVLIIEPSNLGLLFDTLDEISLHIQEGTLKARNHATVITENIVVDLPLRRWSSDDTHLLVIDTNAIPAEQSILLYTYNSGHIDVGTVNPVVKLDGQDIPHDQYSIQYIGPGFNSEHAKFRLTLQYELLQVLREKVLSPQNTQNLQLQLFLDDITEYLSIDVVDVHNWLHVNPDIDKLYLSSINGSAFTSTEPWKQIWIERQQVLQPLYMRGTIDTSLFNNMLGSATISLPDMIGSNKVWMKNSLLERSSNGQQLSSPHMWFDFSEQGIGVPTYIYTKQKLAAHLLLAENAVIEQIEYEVDGLPSATLPSSAYSVQTENGAPNGEKIIRLELQQQWLASIIDQASNPDNVEIIVTVHYKEADSLGTATFVIKHRVMG